MVRLLGGGAGPGCGAAGGLRLNVALSRRAKNAKPALAWRRFPVVAAGVIGLFPGVDSEAEGWHDERLW